VIPTVLAGVVTYVLRFAPLALMRRFERPQWMDRVGDLVAPAAFAAMAAAALATAAATGPAGAGAGRLAAAAVAGAVAHRTRSMWAAIVVGMVAMLALKAATG
jgi:branched-subunit amino acid transport protein